ncbi:uncharacterized protein cubi_02037 [Cryptosporidium ubiquitum]|uniref:Uncharacterized protein n=1 Tax=Cryptosporidium ubiquitum TaxID=857276 RepID=A0A1J4MR89_9CRYT|nr:uncharacterized protein cubi_02037 [Cryptosporidium ubiquitum]OII75516.1 hypothetical protein cubi_02037 [Cryptosporidium ubiquitum]
MTSELASSDELNKVWTQSCEDKTTFSVICSLVQGLFCIINVIFGYFILIRHFNRLLENKSILKILLFTIFGEMITSLMSAMCMILVRLIFGIRSSTYFLSVISLLSTLFQSLFYYSCFAISTTVLYVWYFKVNVHPSDFLYSFVINKNITLDLTRDLLIYFFIEAFISFIEVIYSIPVLVSIIDYGLSKEIDKIKGKPIVEFYSVNQPFTYTNYQNYEKAFEDLNAHFSKSESHYVRL